MNKNLPNVYAVPIEKKITNNKETYMSSMSDERTSENLISKEEIDKLFNAKDHVYKTKTKIKTKNKEIEVEIVGKTNDALLTLSGKKIKIEDIEEIKKV